MIRGYVAGHSPQAPTSLSPFSAGEPAPVNLSPGQGLVGLLDVQGSLQSQAVQAL